jgi:hypothetical protein
MTFSHLQVNSNAANRNADCAFLRFCFLSFSAVASAEGAGV